MRLATPSTSTHGHTTGDHGHAIVTRGMAMGDHGIVRRVQAWMP